MGRTARWAVTLVAASTMMVGGAGVAFAGDWEQDDYSGWTPPSWGMSTASAPADDEPVASKPRKARIGATATVHEDEPGWDCATQGNRVCGPGVGPNTGHDHNVFYGDGPLPYIPGRLTTRPDDSTDGPRCMDSVFAELGHAVPAGTTVGDCD